MIKTNTKKKVLLLIYILLVGATLAVFGTASHYDFVGWDDDIHVYANPYLSSPEFGSIAHFWKGPHISLYMPATFSAWWLLARVSELPCYGGCITKFDPRIFHIANLILHTANVLLVFAILNSLFAPCRGSVFSRRRAAAACVGAMLYAVHPLQVEPVVWVSSMKDLLCGFFSLMALRQYLLYARIFASADRAEGRPHAVLATAAYVLALLSKPAAVSLPLIAWLLVHFRYGNTDFGLKNGKVRALLRRPHAMLLGWLLLAAPFAIMAKFAQSDIPLGFTAPHWARLPIAGDALGFYLFKLFIPLNLGIDYGRIPQLVMDNRWICFMWLIPCCLAAALVLSRHRRQWLAALGIFAAGALPTMGLVPHGYQIFSTVADRFLYLSMLGPALALGWMFLSYRNKAVSCLCLFIVCLLASLSFVQRRYWSDNKALFIHALEINDRSYMAHYNLGMTLDGDDNPAAAIFHYRKALEIKPDYGRAHNNLGAVLTRQGRLAEAIGHFAKALCLEPGNEGAYFNLYMAHNALGVTLARQGKLDEAVEHFLEALRLRPDFAEARANLNQALQNAGKK